MLEEISILDKDAQLTGEYRINPVHVFLTVICHKMRADATSMPIALVNFKLSTNIVTPKINAIKQQFVKESSIA